MNLFCIDPGLRGLGAALFLDGKLSSATYIKNPVTEGRGYDAHRQLAKAVGAAFYPKVIVRCQMLIEHPRIYGLKGAQNDGETDPNDLLDLVGVGAAVASLEWLGAVIPVQTVFPSEWKGNMKKKMMTERIREKLEASGEIERVLSVGAKDHNTLDACGIGLWKLGRLNTKVYPGAT